MDLLQNNTQVYELRESELKEIDGGSELSDTIWRGICYIAGVTAKVHEHHAEHAPWTGHAK